MSTREALKTEAEAQHCMCPACRGGVIHDSDCSVHNMPAYPNGPCDCSQKAEATQAAANGGKTGSPPGLLQDDCRGLSKWLASRPDALRRVREACIEIEAQQRAILAEAAK